MRRKCPCIVRADAGYWGGDVHLSDLELTLSRLLQHGWIESRGEKHHMAIGLTPAGLEAMRSPI
jgi:hypothetical protein